MRNTFTLLATLHLPATIQSIAILLSKRNGTWKKDFARVTYICENLACVDQWNEDTIRARSAELAEKVCEIWIYPKGDMDLSYNMDDLFEEL